MLLGQSNYQLPAVAPITPSTAPGRGGKAARPVRKAHREKPEKLPKNKLACFIGIFLAFLMPGSSLGVIKVTGANYLFVVYLTSPKWVQGAKSPAAELEAAEASNVPSPAKFSLFHSWFCQIAMISPGEVSRCRRLISWISALRRGGQQ